MDKILLPKYQIFSKLEDKIDMFYKQSERITNEEKFDAVIVDEGQDFREEWLLCLEAALKEKGYFYIFADPYQNIFSNDILKIKNMPISKHRLVRNLRNTQKINDWICSVYTEQKLYPTIEGGLEVKYLSWGEEKQQYKMIEDEIGKLVSQGVRPDRITIISSHTKKNSCMKNVDKIKDWPLKMTREADYGAIRFDTIRSYKGLEGDIIFLVDIDERNSRCTKADVYVGGSRARFLLYVFHHKDTDIFRMK